MQKYQNISGNSGVSYFEIGEDYIKVWFHNAKPYIYNDRRPGRLHVDKMKTLATAGQGLATYINQYVHDDYDKA